MFGVVSCSPPPVAANQHQPAALTPHVRVMVPLPRPCSYILYLWYSSLLRLGFRRTLQFEDVFATPDALLTANLQPRFAAEFERQKKLAEGMGEKVGRELSLAAMLACSCCRTAAATGWARLKGCASCIAHVS